MRVRGGWGLLLTRLGLALDPNPNPNPNHNHNHDPNPNPNQVDQGKAAYYVEEYLDQVFPKLSVIEDVKLIL